MANARSLTAKANNSNVGSLILIALVFGSCVTNGEYLGGRRGLEATPVPAATATTTPAAKPTTTATPAAAAAAAATPASSTPAAEKTGTASAPAAATPADAAKTGTAATPSAAATLGAAVTNAATGAAAALGNAVTLGTSEKPAGSGNIYDITKYGAVGDGTTNCFKAFLNSWIQVCNSPTPATLLVPKGNFLVGPLVFAGPCKSKVTVEVQGTVVATTSGFATPEWILFERVDNVLLTGPGTFHGKGEAVWAADGCGKKLACNLPPTSLKFRSLNNLEVTGISSVNAKAFHMFLVKITNVNIHGITITAPAESPNTDGIHLSNADNVRIIDSVIATGDDCVSVGRGSNNVTVEGVTCGPGHGLSVGSLGKYKKEEDVSGIHFTRCIMKGTDNGLRIKTWGGSDPSKCTDIKFEDITMENVKNPIIIDQNYGSRGGDSKVAISDILFKNVRGTTITKSMVQLACSKSTPCQGVNVADVNLKYVGTTAKGVVGAVCANVNVLFGGQLSFPMCPK